MRWCGVEPHVWPPNTWLKIRPKENMAFKVEYETGIILQMEEITFSQRSQTRIA